MYYSERRRYCRLISEPLRASIKPKTRRSRTTLLRTLDLNRCGVCVATYSDLLKEGDKVYVTISRPPLEGGGTLVSRIPSVVRNRASTDDGYRFGLEFLHGSTFFSRLRYRRLKRIEEILYGRNKQVA